MAILSFALLPAEFSYKKKKKEKRKLPFLLFGGSFSFFFLLSVYSRRVRDTVTL